MKPLLQDLLKNVRSTVKNAPLVRGAMAWWSVCTHQKDLPASLRRKFLLASAFNAFLTILAVLNILALFVPVFGPNDGSTGNGLYALAAMIVLIETGMWLALVPKAYLAVIRQSTARRWWGLA